MVLFEDTRIDYGEQRMIGVGLLDYLVVLIVHVENDETIRIISMRKTVRGRIAKQRISIMLDAPIIARYKAIAGERGYQTPINDTLRRACSLPNSAARTPVPAARVIAAEKWTSGALSSTPHST